MKIDLTSCFCQVDVWFNLLSLFFEVGALLKLRWSRPDHERLFRVPGGVAGVLLVSALISGVAIAVMYTIEWKVCVSWYPTAANVSNVVGVSLILIVACPSLGRFTRSASGRV